MDIPLHPSLKQLREKVDTFFASAVTRQPDDYSCTRGCSNCCQVDLSVFPVEADPIAAALDTLPAEKQRAVQARRDAGDHCTFLVEGECVIYEQRPIICRSQGLVLQVAEDERTVCPLNLQGQDLLALPDDVVLNLNTLNTLLSVLHRVHCSQCNRPDERIRLAELPLFKEK